MRFIYFFLLLFICFSVRAQFGSQQIISSEAQLARSVFAADINGNGHQDVIASARIGDFHIAWFENLGGEGNFGAPQIIENDLSGQILTVVAADFEMV